MTETSWGHNAALIIDFAPHPDGSLPPEQVAAAAALGTFMRDCYDHPLAEGSGNASVVTITAPSGSPWTIDRVGVAEDQAMGQLVRAFAITAVLASGEIRSLVNGSSVGNQFVAVLPAPLVGVVSLTLNVTLVAALSPPGAPFVSSFAAYACDAAAQRAADGLARDGFPQPPPSTAAQRLRERAAAVEVGAPLSRATRSQRLSRV